MLNNDPYALIRGQRESSAQFFRTVFVRQKTILVGSLRPTVRANLTVPTPITAMSNPRADG